MIVTNHRAGCLLAAFVFGSVVAPCAHAWGPIAHYMAGIVTPSEQPYMSLPDLWSSRTQISGEGYFGFEASDYFGWSHACLRMGLEKVDTPFDILLTPFRIQVLAIYYPINPTAYAQPLGVELPEMDMRDIVRNKLWYASSTETMLRTAKGFIGHNAADSQVHFNYFLGGSPTNWVLHHNRKERWAEYVVFVNVCGGTWDSLGNGTWSEMLSCQAGPGIICLAQKVHRKNRQTVDGIAPLKTIQVQSSAEIATKVGDMQAEFGPYVHGLNVVDYGLWKVLAGLEGWSETEVVAKLEEAAALAGAAVAGI